MESKFDMTSVLADDNEEFQIGPVIEEPVDTPEGSLLDTSSDQDLDSNSMFGTNSESAGEEAQASDFDEEMRKKQEERRIIEAHNRRVMQSPEFKAQVVFNQYLKQNPYMSGKDKRRLLRECIKNAKRGRYDYMFDEEKIRKREERQKEKFEKLNKPKVHTVDELSKETKDTLVQMADAEEVPAFNKETGSFNKDIIPTFEKE